MAQNGIESGQLKPLALPGERVSLNGVRNIPLTYEDGVGVVPAYSERIAPRPAAEPHVNVSSAELAQIVGVDGSGTPSRPTLLGTDGAEPVLDDHLSGDTQIDFWGAMHPLDQEVRSLESQVIPYEDHEAEAADEPGTKEFNKDGVDMAEYTAGWGRRTEASEKIAASSAARARRKEVREIRMGRVIRALRLETPEDLAETLGEAKAKKWASGASKGKISTAKPVIEARRHVGEHFEDNISALELLGEMEQKRIDSLIAFWSENIHEGSYVPHHVLGLLTPEQQTEYMYRHEEGPDEPEWASLHNIYPEFDRGLTVGGQNPEEAYRNPYNLQADELIAQMFEAPDAEEVPLPRLQRNWREIMNVWRDGKRYTQKDARGLAQQNQFTDQVISTPSTYESDAPTIDRVSDSPAFLSYGEHSPVAPVLERHASRRDQDPDRRQHREELRELNDLHPRRVDAVSSRGVRGKAHIAESESGYVDPKETKPVRARKGITLVFAGPEEAAKAYAPEKTSIPDERVVNPNDVYAAAATLNTGVRRTSWELEVEAEADERDVLDDDTRISLSNF